MTTYFDLKKTCMLLAVILVVTWSICGQDYDYDHDHDQIHIYEGAPAYYLAEHGDFEIGFEENELELHIHLHAGTIVDGESLEEDTSFKPNQLIVVATKEAEMPRPVEDLWGPTGAEVNEPIWILPQHEKEGLPAFGFSTEDIPIDIFLDNQVQLKLRYIDGPGDFSLWENDAFGLPTFIFSTHESINSAIFPVGFHAHYNWCFTAPGDYTIVFEVKAELTSGGQVEALSIYHFKVIEQPICLEPMPADVNGDYVVDENDLHIVEDNLGKTSTTWPANYNHNE